jgi:hypothetical protein
MATCPHCKGHLTDMHRCPRRPAVVITEITVAAIGGGLAGLLVVAAIDPRTQFTTLDSVAIVVGACVAIGIDRALRG